LGYGHLMKTNVPTPVTRAGAVLTIDLDALEHNYRLLARKAGKADCGAAVKGDAYGIGIRQAGPALWNAGCRTFFVARPGEGEELRGILPKAVIYVLDGLYSDQAAYYAKHRLRPALVSPVEAREWAAFSNGRLPCALHVDTGINRLGLSIADFRGIVADAKLMAKLNVTLLMSHLACSDVHDHKMNAQQLARFTTFRKALPDIPASLCNSSGIFLGKAYHFDLVRPGVALYGGNPTPHTKNPMKAVATLDGVVLQVRDVKKDETVGYSATWKAARDSRIAMLGTGYRDGIPRKLSSNKKVPPAVVWIAGKRCPIVGRVSMDMMCIDVTDAKVHKGMHAQIIGNKMPVDEVATRAGTISYEVLTHLGLRYARVYVGGKSKEEKA
jgi:alanine racemase